MKTNYKILSLTFVINLFMALSLNSFSSSSLYLPMMFLYFLSGLAAFIDKVAFYKFACLKSEEYISWICFFVCFLVVCLYIANSLGFIEITFHYNCEIYKVLMQGVPNSFFTFNSIDITSFIFVSAFLVPFSYLALCIIPFLREHGFTKKVIIDISCNHKKNLLFHIFMSFLIGITGIIICHLKYISCTHIYGQPQYVKYFSFFSVISFCFLYLSFLKRNKK